MQFELVIRPEAEKDLEETFIWYESKRKVLGYDFLLQVEAGLNFIQKDPEINLKIYYDARRYLVKRFPYKIYYRLYENKIIVLAVLYSGRDPNWIKKRLK